MLKYEKSKKRYFTTEENKEFLLLVDIINKRITTGDDAIANVVKFYDVMGNEKINSIISESTKKAEFLTGSLPRSLIELRKDRKVMLEAKNDFFASGNDFSYERERRFDPSTVTPKFDYKESRSKRDHYRKKYVDAYVS